MSRVLVLGSTGFLGVHVLRELSRVPGCVVVGASRNPTGGPEGAPAEVVACELDNVDSLPAALERAAPDVVLGLAAMARGGDCEQQPERAARVNALAPGAVATWCQAHGVALVHVSTDLVFDGELTAEERYDESSEPRPVHVYGRTKAAGERAVLAAHPAACVVRLPLLYGDSAGRGCGAPDALLAALDGGQEPALFTDEWRTPLSAEDAARALVECSQLLQAGALPGGILHVAGGERLTRHELGTRVLAAVGRPQDARRLRAVRRADLGLVPARPRDVSLDATRARSILATALRPIEAVLGAGASRS